MRIFLGMITKKLDASAGLYQFIENAEKYGHTISKAVVTCSNGFDKDLYEKVNQKVPLEIIDTNNPIFLIDQFNKRGISKEATQLLLCPPFEDASGLLPYGFNRNLVLMDALIQKAEVLIFVDSDVTPYVLTQKDNAHTLEEIDFFGRHMEYLNAGNLVTISEYSGYNILPEARFDGMEDLLFGLQKEDMTAYWKESDNHHCLTLHQPLEHPEIGGKVLGGNVGFKMEAFVALPPFFSSYYIADDGIYLARGEDTVLSIAIKENEISCMDIKTKIFHDTYLNYPGEPDLCTDAAVQERFYYACTGWIGRNPFYNHVLGNDLPSTKEFQREHLRIGMQALSTYTENPRYLTLLDKFDVSWSSLERYIAEYDELLEAWAQFILKCG